MRRIFCLVVLAALLAAAAAWAAEQIQLTRRDADSLQYKLALINRNAMIRAQRPAARSTTISEREVNSYLRYHAREEIPVGVVEPYIWILGNGRVTGRAIVDLDAVRTERKRGWTDPAGYLTGRLPVQATGILKTQNGVGRLQLEAAEVAGVSIPPGVLQEIVSYYTRTPEQPNGVSLDAPFELPAAIREVKVARGEAIIVQ
ncbi:MAG TPA: hypothetical protein VK886_09115 [Vicinamibacterales bacterium]|nr:hypothetical protein [Vicinamibacterales bacterium]